jgi:hypothetical protein
MARGRRPVLHREHGGLGPAGDLRFGVDVLDVVAGGLRRDAELPRDLTSGEVTGGENEHLDLPLREATRGPRAGAAHLSRAGQDGIDRRRVELAVSGHPTELLARGGRTERRPMGPVLAHRLVAIRGAQGPSTGIVSPAIPRGYPPPSTRSCADAATGARAARPSARRTIRSVKWACKRTRSHSSASSGPGSSQIEFGTLVRPMSWRSAARRPRMTSASGSHAPRPRCDPRPLANDR